MAKGWGEKYEDDIQGLTKGRKAIEINELFDKNRQLVSDWEGIAETTMSFLKTLFTSDLVVDQDRMDRILKIVKK